MNRLTAAIIVAAGRGERLVKAAPGSGPKQYRVIGDTVVLRQTVDQFLNHTDIDHVLVVIHPDDVDHYNSLAMNHPKLLPPVFGGATRQDSSKNGLAALASLSLEKVLIHDAARPFVSEQTITRVIDQISSDRCALPVSSISATVKRVNENQIVVDTVDRTRLVTAQTPQGFPYEVINELHQQAVAQGETGFTDDAAVAEWGGLTVTAVEVADDNMKITTAEDLEIANKRMMDRMTQSSIPDVRTGSGYDVHRLVDGDEIILCGVTIPYHQKLDGHSDADVGLHALTDAILGTIASGDIGSHFPPSDEKWKGANSDQFLKHAVDLVRAQNGILNHVDVTLICEAPKIGPHRDKMRSAIADICELDVSRVSVKATTNERIGFIGREEGIASIASATVCFKPSPIGSKT